MDLETLSWIPIVYTTRLNEMSIFREDLSKTRPKDIIQAIISESKPQYRSKNKPQKLKNKQGPNNDIVNQRRYMHRKANFTLTFNQLRTKLKKMNNNAKFFDNEPEVIIKSEIEMEETKIMSKPKSALALCKPLKIVLEDVNKIKPRRNAEFRTESDSNDEFIIPGENKIHPATTFTAGNSSKTIPTTVNYVLKNIEHFKNILLKEDLRDCVIVIYNLYTKELDAYQIGEYYNVTMYKKRKYTGVYKFPMKRCKIVFNIFACCWKNRQSYVALLRTYKKYINIAKFIISSHLCKGTCACCCSLLEESPEAQDAINKLIESDISHRSIANDNQTKINNCAKLISAALEAINKPVENDIAHSSIANDNRTKVNSSSKVISAALDTIKKPVEKDIARRSIANDNRTKVNSSSKLISAALAYTRKSNWSGSQNQTKFLKDNHSCTRVLKLSFPDDRDEIYEFEQNNFIYSKVMPKTKDINHWLYKTMSQSTNRVNYIFENPNDRETSIVKFRLHDMFSYDTECFLRVPLPIPSNKKDNDTTCRGHFTKKYELEHRRSFMGTGKSTVISIASAINKSKIPEIPDLLPTPSTSHASPPPISARPLTGMNRRGRPPKVKTVMDEEVSRTVNLLIKDILHRFRNVLLTINPDGKVSAALNVPIHTLSHSELSILSQILNHAQSQVDKLGLTPGTCLNPDAFMVINSTIDDSTPATTDTTTKVTEATRSEESDQIKIPQTMRKNRILRDFSRLIVNKKNDYKMSFHRYLGNSLEANPKITNVFTLSNTSNSSSTSNTNSSTSILESRLRGSCEKKYSNINNPTIDINEKDETISLGNEMKSTGPNKRKHETSMEFNTTEAKIRVKSSADIIAGSSASVQTTFTSSTTGNLGADQIPPMPFPPVFTPDSYKVIDSDSLPCSPDIKDEPEIFEFHETEVKPFLVVNADGTITQNTLVFNT